MSWASKRKIIYLSGFVLISIGILAILFYVFIYEVPNCEDGIQNQNEQDVDCGGICSTICSFEIIDPIVLWTRVFNISEGVYNIVALVENPNLNVEAFNIPYSFKIYDKDNILISERTGKVDIPARGAIPIFERTITVGERIPARSPQFKFTKDIEWVKSKNEQPDLSVVNKFLSEKDGMTRLDVTIKNNTVRTVKNIEVTGIISDNQGNAIAVSQTIIDSISKNNLDDIVFTWPGSFSNESSKIEVIVIVK